MTSDDTGKPLTPGCEGAFMLPELTFEHNTVFLLAGPNSLMYVGHPGFDAGPIGARRNRVVVGEGLELGVEFEAAVPPFVEADLATAHGAQPIGRLALNRQLQTAGAQQFEPLEAEARGMHRNLRVPVE